MRITFGSKRLKDYLFFCFKSQCDSFSRLFQHVYIYTYTYVWMCSNHPYMNGRHRIFTPTGCPLTRQVCPAGYMFLCASNPAQNRKPMWISMTTRQDLNAFANDHLARSQKLLKDGNNLFSYTNWEKDRDISNCRYNWNVHQRPIDLMWITTTYTNH